MSILVINAGSSSIKYSLYAKETLQPIDHGLIEEITNHHDAFEVMRKELYKHNIDITKIDAIGHRVVHGGDRFNAPTLIDDELIKVIESLTPLAPLHNPANLEGIYAARAIAPDVEQFAVFDTAFHQTMPEYAYRYPLPNSLYESYHVRRYGFHGISHNYIAAQAAQVLRKPLESLNLITFHIGNGVSACAIQEGVSIDTTMGMTPLDGLMMGSRCGSIDPGIITYLMREADMSGKEIDTLMNKQSGLVGIAGTNDMRTVVNAADEGDRQAQLAIDMYAYRLKKQLGAYMAVMPRIDAVVFTGGIGEHSARIIAMTCSGLEHLGIVLDEAKNSVHETRIHRDSSPVALLVIPTNEELQIALEVKALLDQARLT